MQQYTYVSQEELSMELKMLALLLLIESFGSDEVTQGKLITETNSWGPFFDDHRNQISETLERAIKRSLVSYIAKPLPWWKKVFFFANYKDIFWSSEIKTTDYLEMTLVGELAIGRQSQDADYARELISTKGYLFDAKEHKEPYFFFKNSIKGRVVIIYVQQRPGAA